MKQEATIITTDERDYRVHQLKTVEPYFSAVECGDKTFEVRKFDRDYQIGDLLWLSHYDPNTDKLGRVVIKRITYMLTDKPYVPDGYVVMGIIDDVIKLNI